MLLRSSASCELAHAIAMATHTECASGLITSSRIRSVTSVLPKREGIVWSSVIVLSEHATSPQVQCNHCSKIFCGGATRIRDSTSWVTARSKRAPVRLSDVFMYVDRPVQLATNRLWNSGTQIWTLMSPRTRTTPSEHGAAGSSRSCAGRWQRCSEGGVGGRARCGMRKRRG